MRKICTVLGIASAFFCVSVALAKEHQSLRSEAIILPKGYKAEVYSYGLTVPTTAIFDGQDLLVAESGYLDTSQARVVRIKEDGSVGVEVDKGLNGPITGLLKVDNALYISHKGKVSVFKNGTLTDIVTGLPSDGDHQNDKLVEGPDGKIYLGQGTVTNSGVVGMDSYIFGWLPEHPEAHDVPCKDIVLTGQNFTTDNPLTVSATDTASTEAYHPFGSSSAPGEVVKGSPKCSGAILRFNKDGSDVEMFAWGLRNPFGLSFDVSGNLWVVYHGADVRGSRSIYNDSDYLIQAKEGEWYGWPDYFRNLPATNHELKAVNQAQPTFLLKDHPERSEPYMLLPTHAGANGFAFAPSEFGYGGDAFVAFFGTLGPVTAGTNLTWPGFSVARIDMKQKRVEHFADNRVQGPTYLNHDGGFDRPSDVVFGPDHAMYVVDFGGGRFTKEGLMLDAGTGAIWRIYKEEMGAKRPNGPILISSPAGGSVPKPVVTNKIETYQAMLSTSAWVLLPLVGLLIIIVYLGKRR